VEFLSPPKEQFFGTEAVFKDPFGKMVQPDAGDIEVRRVTPP
jgi:hypothetical protein